MVKALRFKGDKKVKKRKRPTVDDAAAAAAAAADSGAEDADPDSTAPSGPSTKKPKPDLTTTAAAAAAAAAEHTDPDEGWVDADCLEDITGPIMLLITGATPHCLSSDPTTGQIFTTPLTPPHLEPTGIHQVWVATRIHGTSKHSFKAAHGRYLSVDRVGVASATREAIGAEEEFDVAPVLGGSRWALQGARGAFVGVQEEGGKTVVRGDREAVAYGEEWVVRVQRRNKKKRKGAGGEGRVKDRVTRKELEEMAGVKLDDEQVKALKKARKEGGFHEALLDIRVKHGKHDKFAY